MNQLDSIQKDVQELKAILGALAGRPEENHSGPTDRERIDHYREMLQAAQLKRSLKNKNHDRNR